MLFSLAWKSLRNRRFTAGLTVFSIALAVMLLLAVERVRQDSREGFASAVSGTDLIVGARASPVHLLLYSVFRLGNATHGMRWDSYRALAQHPAVAWTIPLSLGDSHRGFRVLGTTVAYFEHLRFGRDRKLTLAQGKFFQDEHDAVLGSEVAAALGYRIGDPIVMAHGAGDISFIEHAEQPLRVAGVLAATGTPADRTVHVTLQALDQVHADPAGPADDPLADAAFDDAAASAAGEAQHTSAEKHFGVDDTLAEPGRQITAFLVGLKSRSAALAVQRHINQFGAESLSAILPGPTLQELWQIVGTVENTLLAISSLVVVVGLAGMLIALLTGLSERRREMAILRSVGARPAQVFALIVGEAAFLTALGICFGVAALYLGLAGAQSWLEARMGLFVSIGWPSSQELGLLALVAGAGIAIGLIPAYRIYRHSLADGMTIRV